MEFGNIVEYDAASGVGRILSTEGRSLFFQQFGAFTIGQLVCFKLGEWAVKVKPASGESPIGVIAVSNDAANSVKQFNPAYHGQRGDREAIAAQVPESDAPAIDCGTFSDNSDDLKSPTFRPWSD
ncbi:MAG TPA: hypothetical protein VMB47_11380 [Candidatus Aquilonibacter sp.]|nr:hypothetical protein [Candidatus Aquilonibacter sp.]